MARMVQNELHTIVHESRAMRKHNSMRYPTYAQSEQYALADGRGAAWLRRCVVAAPRRTWPRVIILLLAFSGMPRRTPPAAHPLVPMTLATETHGEDVKASLPNAPGCLVRKRKKRPQSNSRHGRSSELPMPVAALPPPKPSEPNAATLADAFAHELVGMHACQVGKEFYGVVKKVGALGMLDVEFTSGVIEPVRFADAVLPAAVLKIPGLPDLRRTASEY